jgi:hypothetical protein
MNSVENRAVADIAQRTLITRLQVKPEIALQLSDEMLAELSRDEACTELVVVKVTDFNGEPHAIVVRKPPARSLPLFKFDVDKLREAARELVADRRAVDNAVDEDGTEI